MKKITWIAALVVLHFSITNCTSKKSDNLDAPPEADSLSLDGDPAQDPNQSAAQAGNESQAPSGNPDETQAGFLDDQLADPNAAPPADPNAAPPADLAAQDPTAVPPPADQTPPPEAQPPAELPPPEVVAGVDPGQEVAPAPPPDATPIEPEKQIAEAPKPVAPLRKVEGSPFRRSGVLLNAVYIARPGDSYASISEKVYGDKTHAKQLKKVNPGIAKPKPGDKVYYNSPQRPQDETHLANFYEDKGIPSQTYIAQDGDNLKKIGPKLLGYPGAWKEIWVTNPVESKGVMLAGTELRYWGAQPANPPMAEQLPPPPPMQELPPPPAPPQEVASNQQQAPAPPVQELPPPPPMQELPPPPPPPAPMPVAKKPPMPPPAPAGALDSDTMTLAAGGAVALAAVAALMIIRRRRASKEMQAAFGDTQVG